MGGEFVGPHLDPEAIRAAYGAKGVDVSDILPEARYGIVPPVLPHTAANQARLRRGNHPSACAHAPEVWKRLLTDVTTGRVLLLPVSMALALPLLHLCPIGAIAQKDKVRVIHDLTYSLHLGRGEVCPGLNSLTDLSQVPPTDIGGVFAAVCRRAYGLRLLYPHDHICFAKADVADAFRQLLVHPAFAPLVAYTWGEDFISVELRLVFGWNASPGFFYRWALKMVEYVRATRPSDITDDLMEKLELLKQIEVEEPPPAEEIVALPADPDAEEEFRREGLAAHGDAPFDVNEFLDDMLAVDVNRDGRLRRATAAMLLAHYDLFGWPRDGKPPCIKPSKLTGWSAVGEMLGLEVDLNKMVLRLPSRKWEELMVMLNSEWVPSRKRATPRQVLTLIGKLRSFSECIRPGRYFLRQMIKSVEGFTAKWQLDKEIRIPPRLKADVEFWRCIVSNPDLVEAHFATPIYAHVRRRPELLAISDACLEGGGGFVAPLGVWWRIEWPRDIVERARATLAKTAAPGQDVTINHLELASLLLGVAVMVDQAEGCGVELVGKTVLALADNTNAVAGVRKAGARDGKAAAMLRAHGVEEAVARFSTMARHLAGVDNSISDTLSRESQAECERAMAGVTNCPLSGAPVRWRQVSPPANWINYVLALLRTSSWAAHELALPRALTTPTSSSSSIGV